MALTLWTHKSVWVGTLATIEYVVVPKVEATSVSPLCVEQWNWPKAIPILLPVFHPSVELTNVVSLSSNQTITFQLADRHGGISWRTIKCKQCGGFCHSRMVTNVDVHGSLFALGSQHALISAACEMQARVIVRSTELAKASIVLFCRMLPTICTIIAHLILCINTTDWSFCRPWGHNLAQMAAKQVNIMSPNYRVYCVIVRDTVFLLAFLLTFQLHLAAETAAKNAKKTLPASLSDTAVPIVFYAV